MEDWNDGMMVEWRSEVGSRKSEVRGKKERRSRIKKIRNPSLPHPPSAPSPKGEGHLPGISAIKFKSEIRNS